MPDLKSNVYNMISLPGCDILKLALMFAIFLKFHCIKTDL